MPSITFPPVINRAPVISRVGGENHFAELSFLPIGGGLVELICTRVEYDEFSGKYLRDVIDSAEVEEEDAENVAVDFQYAAKEVLGDDYYSMPADPCGFGEAVEREFEMIYAIAAE